MLEEELVAEELVSKMLHCSMVILRLCSTYLTCTDHRTSGMTAFVLVHLDYFLFSHVHCQNL